MKNYEALTTFHGIISLNKGERKMLDPQNFIVQDLVRAKLIAEVEEKKKPAKKKATKKTEEPAEDETKGAE